MCTCSHATYLLVEEVLPLTEAAEPLLVVVVRESKLVRHSEVVNESSQDMGKVPLQVIPTSDLLAKQHPAKNIMFGVKGQTPPTHKTQTHLCM